MSFQGTAILLAWVAIVLLGLALAGLLRQVHYLRRPGPATEASLAPRAGEIVSALVSELSSSRRSVLFFAHSDCVSCERVFPTFRELAGRFRELSWKVIYEGKYTLQDGSDEFEILSDRGDLFEALRVPVTPYGIVVSEAGAILAAGPVGSGALLEALVDRGRDKEAA